MIGDCTGLIMAGGDSRRMGRDKTALDFGGRTLLQRAASLMQGIFPRVLVSVRRPRADLALAQVTDELPDAGPLAGLCAGLAGAGTPWVFALAVDMPLLGSGLIRELAGRRDGFEAVVPVVRDVPQPLAAYYAVSALPVLRAALAGPGRRGPRAVLERLNACLVRADGMQDGFIDLDTPGDVAVALKKHGDREDTERTEGG
jgi:molybdopterin-guanine dinucleotide biosynthesis protein A